MAKRRKRQQPKTDPKPAKPEDVAENELEVRWFAAGDRMGPRPKPEEWERP